MLLQHDNKSTVDALLNAFGSSKGDGARRQAAITARVTDLLFKELYLLTEECHRAGFSNDSRQPINNAFERLSPHGLVTTWQQNRVHFLACMPSLRIFGEGLVDEGTAIDKGQLDELHRSITSLREEIEKSELPDFVKRFGDEQLDFIISAIQDYPLAGVKAFRTAMGKGV